MNTSFLNTNAADRFVEALIGSSSLLADSTGRAADQPLLLSSGSPGSDPTDTAPPQQANGVVETIAPVGLLEPVTSLIDGAGAGGS